MTSLFDDVDLLSLDAGNVVIFLDHARVAAVVRDASGGAIALDPSALVVAEGEAKRALTRPDDLVDVAWEIAEEAPGARPWGLLVATMLARAGVARDRLAALVSALWREHRRFNLWSLVPAGLADAVARVRAAGVKVVIVSNSEGTLASLFEQVGVLAAFDAVIDSGVVGVEKPDPRIFESALAPYAVSPSRAIHLGDTYATDVLGARAAGMRVALVDVHRHYEGLHPDVPRVESVAAACDAILRARRPG